ncbi:MAG: hypothetical protein ACRC41_08940 [Sarcina sp.]
MKIGYASSPLTINARTNKKVVSKYFSNEDFINSLKINLENLKKILEYNIENDIKLFEISSDILDNAKFFDADEDWTSILKKELNELSTLIQKHSLRITMFPQKFTLLNSPNLEVVEKAIEFLNIHIKFMDALNLDSSNKIFLEVGGIYTNKNAAKERFINVYNTLPHTLKNKLVLINDKKNFSFIDLLEIHKRTKATISINILYDEVFNNSNLTLKEKFEKLSETWNLKDEKIIIHYSTQNHTKKKGFIANTINIDEFLDIYPTLKTFSTDICLEFNDKNISVIKCQNIISEIKNGSFSKVAIKAEFEKYKLLILERGEEFVSSAELLANSTDSIIEFYRFINKVLEQFVNTYTEILAIREALKIMSKFIKHAEKNHIEKLLLNNKLKRCKSYMLEIALRNNVDIILKTYFFSSI